jgi:catechol 2,3-dioxygenase-like lactoylglutathione lyase family enzyme
VGIHARMAGMSVMFGAVVLSTPDPVELAAFYRELLGWVTVAEEPDWVRLRDPERERPGLSFQLEPGDVPPTWPASDGGVQMQAHLDLLVDDLDVEVARATALGAVAETHQPSEGVRVLRDPHGHVFCLFLPGA